MNKKISNIILIAGLIIILLLYVNYISAEENVSDSNISEVQESETQIQEQNNSTENPEISPLKDIADEPQNETENNTFNSEEISLSSETEIIELEQQNETNSTNETTDYVKDINSGDSNSGGSSESVVEYTPLEEINNNVSENNSEVIESEGNTNNICFGYDSLGKKVIEIRDCKDGDIEKVNEPKELEKGQFEKEVIISSQEELNKPLRIYTSLAIETEIENIKIYWENEGNLEITGLNEFSVEYYDKDNNGVIEEISWIVPHLSEQIFNIVIDLNSSIESPGQLLLEVSGPIGQTRNPVTFNIKVNYSSNFSCELKVGNTWYYNISSDENYIINLSNGNYNWEAYCFDILNMSYINATLVNFSINEEYFSSLQEGKLYFLDLVENKIKNPETIIINSSNPSSFIIKIFRNGQIIYTKSAYNLTTLIMNESILNSSGIYNLSIEFDEPSPKVNLLTNFSVASANLTFNTSQIKEGQSVKVTVNVISPIKKINPIILDYGDGSSNVSTTETNLFNQDFIKKYPNNGQYTVKLITTIGGTTFPPIQKNGISVTKDSTNTTDDDAPSINLLNPDDEDILSDTIVNFSYKASDDVKIQNCTFKLYENCASMNYCSTSDSNLVFPLNSQQRALANNYSVQNNKEVKIALKDFEDGIYEWIVECYDNSSNYDWEISFFEINVNDSLDESSEGYTKKEEIGELKQQADDFITTNFNLEEKEVIEELNLLNDTKYYKKRLLDIENFFKENYKYVSSETLREQKIEGYLAELEEIKNKIPKSVIIKGSNEYIKNSVETDFEKLIEEYFQATNTQISKASINKLAKINRELQNELSVSVKVKEVEIEYENWTQKITLIKKEIDLNDDSYNKILEVIPKEVAESAEEVIFLNDNRVINEDPLFEINYEDLEKDEIIYYISSPLKLKDVEKTETLLFEDDLNKFEGRVTGFFVFEFISGEFTLYFIVAFILLIALLFIIPFVLKKFRIASWKKEPNVVKVFNLLEDIQKLLKEKEIEKARENYYKIKEIYPVLPTKTKGYFYEKIKEMLIKIDRKDIFNLVKEYQEAKRKWNKEDYMRLYEDIKKIYERLPEKDRRKVYEIINGY